MYAYRHWQPIADLLDAAESESQFRASLLDTHRRTFAPSEITPQAPYSVLLQAEMAQHYASSLFDEERALRRAERRGLTVSWVLCGLYVISAIVAALVA